MMTLLDRVLQVRPPAKPLLPLIIAILMTGCHSFGPDGLKGTYHFITRQLLKAKMNSRTKYCAPSLS